LIWIPTSWAHQYTVILGLDDFFSQNRQFVLKTTAIALRNRILTRGKPVTHD